MIEIERKFLVKSLSFKNEARTKEHIIQGFLNTDPNRTVRVRIKNNTGYLTIKGITNSSGMSRYEWEKEVHLNDAETLLKLCEEELLEKDRFIVPKGRHIYEVDEFKGKNSGLIMAELELESEEEPFESPDWLGEEVTGDPKYYNSALSKQPYNTWKE